jgi:hypothetical protein
MPAKVKTEDKTPPAEPATPAEAAAAEALPEQQTDTVIVPFRGLEVPVPNPAKNGDSFAVQMAVASGSNARLLYALVGDRGTRLIESTLTDEDVFLDVVSEFFTAYGEVTGAGNS